MKKFVHFIRNLSVSWKFVSAYFSILIIPMILMGAYIYIQNSDSAVSQARLVMEQNLLQTKASIIQKEKIIESSVKALIDERFENFLGLGYSNEVYRVEDYQFNFSQSIRNILQQDPTIYSIRVYMDNAITLEMRDSYSSVRNYESPDLYKTMLAFKPGKDGWRSTHNAAPHLLRNDTSGPVQVFSYTKSVYPMNFKSKRGVIVVETRENVLFDMLRYPVISKLGKVFVVDSGGKIVSDNIPELFKKDVSTTGFHQFDTQKETSSIHKVNGISSIIITVPVNEIGCSIVGIFPVHNFNSEINKSLWLFILLLAICSIFLGFIMYFITNALLSRVKKLVKAMKQVKEENLDVSVPVKAMDEFGELALNFNRMTKRIHELVEMVYKIQIMEREAELKAWEAQINPHFLYNTLATISWAARKAESQEIVQISNSLAKFYRLVLSKGNSLITVKDELDMVKAFLQIQKIRFGDKFDAVYHIDEDVYSCTVVKNLLQPLVENALNHGIDPKRSHGTIIIKVWRINKSLTLQVIDDGIGMSAPTLSDVISQQVEKSNGSGYAVKNIMERLKAYYGKGYLFDIFSRQGIGTVVTITIPEDDSN